MPYAEKFSRHEGEPLDDRPRDEKPVESGPQGPVCPSGKVYYACSPDLAPDASASDFPEDAGACTVSSIGLVCSDQ